MIAYSYANPELSIEMLKRFEDIVELKQCYNNCSTIMTTVRFAVESDNYRYVEGIVIDELLGPVPIEHAWLVDVYGNIIDPTFAKVRPADELEKCVYFPGRSLNRNEVLRAIIKGCEENKRPDGAMLYYPLFVYHVDCGVSWRDRLYASSMMAANIYIALSMFEAESDDPYIDFNMDHWLKILELTDGQ